jgi:hypothetical protein
LSLSSDRLQVRQRLALIGDMSLPLRKQRDERPNQADDD